MEKQENERENRSLSTQELIEILTALTPDEVTEARQILEFRAKVELQVSQFQTQLWKKDMKISELEKALEVSENLRNSETERANKYELASQERMVKLSRWREWARRLLVGQPGIGVATEDDLIAMLSAKFAEMEKPVVLQPNVPGCVACSPL